MRESNATFDALHVNRYKAPLYLVHFDGLTEDFANRAVGNSTYDVFLYLGSISGASQTVTPEEGRASIGGLKITLIDPEIYAELIYVDSTIYYVDNTDISAIGYGNPQAITRVLASDATFFHRKKTTVKAGYAGMDEADLLNVITGWVTDIKLTGDGLGYELTITDPIKWMQRKIFREASDASPFTFGGNPIDVMLKILTSTGNGTNGDYDQYDEENGLGIDEDYINIENILTVRDDWFTGLKFRWTVKDRIQAKKWLETEIWQVLNIYPTIDADGKFNVKPFKPPLASGYETQEFTEKTVMDLPSWDMNLPATINEVEFNYNWNSTNEEYDTEAFFIDATSLNARGPGKKPLKIESKGVHGSNSPVLDMGGDEFVDERKQRIFARYATPPLEVSFNTFFTQWLSEAGDVVKFSHSLLPDMNNGSRGLTENRMEIISRDVDWARGKVKFQLLDTGFAKNVYCVISPSMTVTSGTSTTIFDVDDASQYEEGWVIDVFKPNMSDDTSETNHTITDITGNQITVSPVMTGTPTSGDIVQFSDYDNLTDAQKLYWALCDSNDTLGTDEDDPHLLVA